MNTTFRCCGMVGSVVTSGSPSFVRCSWVVIGSIFVSVPAVYFFHARVRVTCVGVCFCESFMCVCLRVCARGLCCSSVPVICVSFVCVRVRFRVCMSFIGVWRSSVPVCRLSVSASVVHLSLVSVSVVHMCLCLCPCLSVVHPCLCVSVYRSSVPVPVPVVALLLKATSLDRETFSHIDMLQGAYKFEQEPFRKFYFES